MKLWHNYYTVSSIYAVECRVFNDLSSLTKFYTIEMIAQISTATTETYK